MFSNTFMRLLSPCCVLCGKSSQRPSNICLPCERDLPRLPHHCLQCAHSIPISPDSSNLPLSVPCGECQQNPPPFDRTLALFPYEPPIVHLIMALKFQRKLAFAKLLGELFTRRIQEDWYKASPLPEVIIPMPLHQKRLSERGFNQALEIARPISRALRIPLDTKGAMRIKNTAMQSALSRHQRKNNLQHAFSLKQTYLGSFIAVLDDVMTTQHTMIALCQLLKAKGARRIDVWCASRAMGHIA